ncbi:phosphate/phosphite/phosphonate ABC transporter substrate-binding protein [Sulfitobacter mediterraneus]|uniref:phosphate/phosphite/phosphonate ABC transporter substrate-binding protein n=1 Tax=Sulfitobacter mediterraneus TaxID=83219 RepID=UPI001EEE9C70|nr:PhnD/SsuA/transferrin family substrate-binding protein [Sulfitobacter mediterraneus]
MIGLAALELRLETTGGLPVIASLMMYLRPENAQAHDRYWTLIRAELAQRGIDAPEKPDNARDEFEVWTADDLVLSQTCGMPYRKWLHDKVTLIGTPDYGVKGCEAGYYNSVIVVRADDHRTGLPAYRDARFTYNQTFSQSGYAAPFALAKTHGFWFENRSQSHGHLNSARAVAEGRADIAALDVVTWQLIQKYDAFAADLRVLAQTSPTPGLPYIAAAGVDRQATYEAVSAAIAGLDQADRDALCLKGLTHIPKAAYLAISNPPETAG